MNTLDPLSFWSKHNSKVNGFSNRPNINYFHSHPPSHPYPPLPSATMLSRLAPPQPIATGSVVPSLEDHPDITGLIADVVYNIIHGSNTWGSYSASPSFRNYAKEIMRKLYISSASILLSVKYLHQYKIGNPMAKPEAGHEYLLFTVALMTAAKYHDDLVYTNKTWSDASSFPLQVLNFVEMEFLTALRYDLYLQPEEYDQWLCILQQNLGVAAQARVWDTQPTQAPCGCRLTAKNELVACNKHTCNRNRAHENFHRHQPLQSYLL
ncbi:hypothetical protein K493DRAFT_312413 [Basidiobolus meristosporus CBS 931.73]|uniref:Cyclin N-terminal domain-containing protein n=1 Tax=Basidiobolus meristosporus CBS 931.73 TaxID=1314790 RepID=A0A1Y1YTX2_9FUNG|nr:hypothetical protein K493DRAFT_312413 [Basidiobolus meristosporus CBS 931.73]|eukprot:ORY01461.1 hypothetical protein K493DRAFT_312413 [Basidiobolus meristosporus CBS 931.73]